MRTWQRKTYRIEEREFDRDIHSFWLIRGNMLLGKITPVSLEVQGQIVTDLDNGHDVNGWEDGFGNTIQI